MLNSVPAWAKFYVAAILESGVMEGSEGKFNGNEALSRAQMATIVGRIHVSSGAGSERKAFLSGLKLIMHLS